MQSANSSATTLALDFAAIYHCAIKPFKHCPQKKAVCVFLLDTVPEGKLPLSDAVCSNYISGKRAIPDEYRTALAGITPDALLRKCQVCGINDLQPVEDALRHLVDHVSLSTSTFNRLVKLYETSTKVNEPLTFLVEVFRTCSDAKGNHKLTEAEIGLLTSFAAPAAPAATADGSAIDDAATDSGFTREDLEWMQEYLPPKVSVSHSSFFGSSVYINRQVLRLPHDFAPMLYMLKPALKGMPIDTFTYDDFISVTGISPATGKMSHGLLKCIKLTGPVDGITATLENANLSDVCASVMLMRGRITLKEAVQVEKAVKKASNSRITFIRSLVFDSRLSNVEVTLFLRVDREIADDQRNPGDDTDMKIYKKHTRR